MVMVRPSTTGAADPLTTEPPPGNAHAVPAHKTNMTVTIHGSTFAFLPFLIRIKPPFSSSSPDSLFVVF
jgi:hypothetical protein